MRKARKPRKTETRPRADDGTLYPACKPLPFTPGYDKLVPGLRCLVVCLQRDKWGGTHNSVPCKIKECYEHVILIGVGKWYRDTYLVSPLYLAKLRRDGTIPDSFYHRLVLGCFSRERQMPEKLQAYIRKETKMGRGDRRVRSHSKKKTKKVKKKRRTPAERRAKAKRISSKKSTKKPKKKRVSIKAVLFAYFDKVGLKKITYERSLKIAKSVKPDTMFNRVHFSWYRGKYRTERGIK